MPDWTYVPVLRPALRRLGPERATRTALGSMSRLSALPGGTGLLRLMAWSYPLPGAGTTVLDRPLTSPVGVGAGVDTTGGAARGLDALGAGFVEVGPVSSLETVVAPHMDGLLLLRVAPGAVAGLGPPPARFDAVVVEADETHVALRWGRPVLAAAADAHTARVALDGCACGVVVPSSVLSALPADTLAIVVEEAAAPDDAVALIASGATLVGLSATALRREGPALPQRCAEAVALRAPPPHRASSAPRPVAGWLAGLLIGLALVATGVGAAAISFGPVLLGYDRAFLGGGTELLDVGRLLPFVRHDRITFAGVGLSIGLLYLALAWWGVRRGVRWARATLAASCAVGMTTLLLFLGFGYFDPLHASVTALLVPLLLVAVLQPLPPPSDPHRREPARHVRERALVGQLLLVVVAVGLLGGGALISAIGVGGVFVASDLTYLGITPDDLRSISDRIIPFVAHDRAGFGGALVPLGLAVLGVSMWGVTPGNAWVWWALLGSAVAAFVPTLVVHTAVGYTDVAHLAPVYLAGALTAVALALTRPYLLTGLRTVAG